MSVTMRGVVLLRLVPHMAVYSGDHAPNSLAAIRECASADVQRIEIDVHSLADGDFIVSHDRRLEDSTTGEGALGRVTASDVRTARFRDRPDDRPALLSEVIRIARESRLEVQLDLKDWRPLSDERVRVLDDLVAPMRERVIVSSGQEWNLLRLRAVAPEIAVGFDPGFYLAHATADGGTPLPRNRGAYGYLDDHPLAFGRAEETETYLARRFEALILQAPGSREFFLSYQLALMMLGDGFNAASFLHSRGIDANVWTLDYAGPDSVVVLARLRDDGFDRVTTNTAPAWERAMAVR
jgi:glycerophosphoryl diester phosphodiesterase